jgi:CDP-2,3-bis-(O-geranylgeranyl)-sn-glycerol synthase
MMILTCLILLLTANGAPLLARLLPGLRHWNRPLDSGYRLIDGERLFGQHKTWRGLFAAILLTAPVAWFLNLPLWLGILFALFSMLGDLLGSFVKRRWHIAPGARAIGLDQLPEALLPLLLLRQPLGLGWHSILITTVLFMIVVLLLSRILYYLRIRKNPW